MKPWFWVSAVVILAAACLLTYAWLHPEMVAGVPSYAPQGQVVAGFPDILLLDSSARVTESYSIMYSSSTKQYTVQWESPAPPMSIAAGYALYFSSHGWNILTEASSSDGSLDGIYAVTSSSAVNFTATASGTGSAVVLSYLNQPQ